MPTSSPKSPSVLWWSRSDRSYSRDRVVRESFGELGWTIVDFQPSTSQLGDLEAAVRKLPSTDVVWVPCFRQRDLAAAQRWACRRAIPVIADPLISAWDKQVFERRKMTETSWRAQRLKRWEARLLQRSDFVIADTDLHAQFFSNELQVPKERIHVIPVSAQESLFEPQPQRAGEGATLQVLFFGSFIRLQGPQVIAKAAALVPDVDWTFIGSGPLLNDCLKIAGDLPNTTFLPRFPYEELPAQIGNADLLLGIFGGSQKAGRVIPNKAYQALASGRPLVTRTSAAWPDELRAGFALSGIQFVEADDAHALASAVRKAAQDREELTRAAQVARQTFDAHFGNGVVRRQLRAVLEAVIRPGETTA